MNARPEITAQSNDRDPQEIDTISIQALSSFPELLGNVATRYKRKIKAHESDCECSTCEHGDPEVRELDF